ncbi:MAG: hypothetical protein LBU04_01965, partial [Christensenellaceae bacterium]|nr:hypothetical protein [Christensenellaceae bacterium]
MYIEINITNGRKYLKLGKSLRVKNKDGYSVCKKTTVLNIGALSNFDDGKPDYLKRLRESFLNGNPLIPALLPYCSMQKQKKKYEFTIEEGGLSCLGHPKIYSHQFLDRIIDELGIKRLFYLNKSMRKIEYDVYGFFKLLVFGRILHPASKISTVEQ